jgi:tRNA(fMet)-specific endonuclease VapC
LIVDTNALSAIADDQPGIGEVLRGARVVAIPVITLGEYRFGILQSRRRSDNERWLRDSLPAYRILDISDETTLHYAELRLKLKRAGTPIPSNDLWIAALGRQYEMQILSRDRHFDAVEGIRRISW